MGTDCQYRLGARAGREPVQVGIRRRGARYRRLHQNGGAGGGGAGNYGQRAVPRLRAHAAGGEADPRYRESPRHLGRGREARCTARRAADEEVCRRRGDRRTHRLPLLAGSRIDHRRGAADRRRLDRSMRAALPGQVVLVLQGGGALGAYQVGVYEALHESGIEPDWVIGTSIGAINGAIIAGNKPEDRLPRLRQLWARFQQEPQFQALQYFSTFVRGIPGFFSPRLPAWGGWQARVGLDAASYYSTTPLHETLASLTDLAVLNTAHPRLTVGAVNVESGELRYFDSRDGALGLEEVMASGALPPGFPAVRVD